jgi:hypothetical protein
MMNNYIEEYKKLLNGEREKFPKGFWDSCSKENREEIFKYLFDEVLQWNLDKLIKELDYKTILKYHLGHAFSKYYNKAIGTLIKSIYPNSIENNLPAKESTKLKISNAQKNLSPEKRERILRGQRENRYTAEYAKKLSDTKLGEVNPQHKLKTEQVMEIKKLWETKEYTTTSLGEKFGVKRQTIADIVYGRTWKHV